LPDRRAVRHLTFDEALAIHALALGRFGGSGGVRDPGLLESALYRPRSGHYSDVAEMAAALFESLLVNHPFVDGNKRVAFFATDVFLRMNGWRLEIDDVETHEFILGLLASHGPKYDDALDWIRSHLVRA